MNAREGIDLAKMAIAASILCLLLSACLGVWYLLSDRETRYQRSMESAATTTVMDRFRDFEEESKNASIEGNNERYPLVSSVANAVSEFNEDSLLYIYVYTRGGTDKNLYTYMDIDEVELRNALNDNDIKIYHSESPTTKAVRKLLTYSKERCAVQKTDAVYGNNTGTNDLHFTGIEVLILN